MKKILLAAVVGSFVASFSDAHCMKCAECVNYEECPYEGAWKKSGWAGLPPPDQMSSNCVNAPHCNEHGCLIGARSAHWMAERVHGQTDIIDPFHPLGFDDIDYEYPLIVKATGQDNSFDIYDYIFGQ